MTRRAVLVALVAALAVVPAVPSSAQLSGCLRVPDPVGDASPAPLAGDGDDISLLTVTISRGRLVSRFRLTAAPDFSLDVRGRSYSTDFFLDRGYLTLAAEHDEGGWSGFAFWAPERGPGTPTPVDGADAGFDARTGIVTASVPLAQISDLEGRRLSAMTVASAGSSSRLLVADDVEAGGVVYAGGRTC